MKIDPKQRLLSKCVVDSEIMGELTAEQACELCGGVGLVPAQVNGKPSSRPCECQQPAAAEARIARAGIPGGFAKASFKTFDSKPHNSRAIGVAWRFCEEFLPGKGQRNRGLLLTGSVGSGKTHLAVAAMRELVVNKGIEARFVLVPELLDRLRSSYDDDAGESQRKILRPIFEADLVVIDELGSSRPSDWVFETVELVIGGLYNRMGPVIVTTNFANLGPGQSVTNVTNEYARAARPETLGDRIGARMWSRLQEMTVCVEIKGVDMRQRSL
jgi:DNA replication protein DnaC